MNQIDVLIKTLATAQAELDAADRVIAKLKSQIADLECALEYALEFCEDRAAAVNDQDGLPTPNTAMQLSVIIRESLGRTE